MEIKAIKLKHIISIIIFFGILILLISRFYEINKSFSYDKFILEHEFQEKIDDRNIIYRIFETEIDNYTYEILLKSNDEIEKHIANLYLNDSTYRNVSLNIESINNNSLILTSNRKFIIDLSENSVYKLIIKKP